MLPLVMELLFCSNRSIHLSNLGYSFSYIVLVSSLYELERMLAVVLSFRSLQGEFDSCLHDLSKN